jgi:acetyl-CoA carboxylase biotin carboxyl carrier protein
MNIKKIKELIRLLENSNIEELEVDSIFSSIKLRKTQESTKIKRSTASRHETKDIDETETVESEKKTSIETKSSGKLTQITAPMVGTFYRAPSPTSEPYVKVGDTVKEGQVLCIIEAMKLMNEIKSEYSGTIKEIHIENAEPVEFGTVLFSIET